MRISKRVIFILASLGIGGFFGARGVARSNASPSASSDAVRAPAVLRVPRVAAPITLDGELDELAWSGGVARTGAFLGGDGAPARPYSDARLAWGDGLLYVALYAADEDVRAEPRSPDAPVWLDDSFHLVFFSSGDGVERVLDVSALGVVTDSVRRSGGAPDYSWQSGAIVSHENDGTLNDARDDDEEWIIEMAIPLASLGLKGERGERVELALRRCDTPRGSSRVCGSWGAPRATIVLD